jgi:hypothetical protein
MPDDGQILQCTNKREIKSNVSKRRTDRAEALATDTGSGEIV